MSMIIFYIIVALILVVIISSGLLYMNKFAVIESSTRSAIQIMEEDRSDI